MTLPAFSAAGTGSTGDPAWPTHATGHLGLLFIEWDGTNSPSTPSGWNVVPGSPITQPSTKFAVFYRFATSSGEGAPVIAITSEDHHWAVIVTYTGVNTINPFHIISTTSSASIALKTFPGFTTFLQDCLIVNALGWGLDNAGPLFSTETNADLGSIAERSDAGTLNASGGGVYVNDGTKATKGEFTYTQVTPSTNTISNGITLALQAADQSFGTKSQIINTKRRTMFVKQSTAQSWRFAMFDSADGVTGKTGLTLAVTIQKEGDTSFASISPTVTEIGSGHYNAALTTTHMNTVGCTSLRATSTGAIPADCPNCIDVVAFDKTDAFRGTAGSALPGVAAEGAGGLFTRGTGAGQIKQSANGQIDANLATWNLNGTSASTTVPKALTAAGEAKVMDDGGNAVARSSVLGTPAGASVSADIAAIQADTDNIQTRIPAALTGAGNMKADLEEVNASNSAVSTTVPSRLNASGQFPSNVLRVNADATAAANLALQYNGTGLTGGTFPAPQSQVTTLSADAVTGLASLQADTDDIQGRLPAALTGAGNMKSDALAISGDTTAADNLESAFDGTGLPGAQFPARQVDVNNIAASSAAINLTALSRAITTGTEAGSLTNTNQRDATTWDIAAAGGTIDVTIDFDISQVSGGLATLLSMFAGLVGAGVSVDVQARNWTGASWDKIGQIDGGASLALAEFEEALTNAHTSAGVARIRFSGTSLGVATLKVDYMLVGATAVPPTVASISSGISLSRSSFAQDAKDMFGEARRFTAAGGSTTTVVFDAGASVVDDFYLSYSLLCVGGAGQGQTASVPTTPGSYVGGTKTATLDHTVATAFDNTSVFELRAAGGGASASTGGGGGGTTGYGEQRIEVDGSMPIHFTLLDSAGERATGASAAILCKVSINGGSAVSSAGTFHEIDAGDQPGEYYYEPGGSEDSEIGSSVVLYITPNDFDFVPQSIMVRVVAPIVDADTIVNTLAEYAHDTGVSLGGLWKRIEAWLTGERDIVTVGTNDHYDYKDKDGNTAFEGDLDNETGARGAADTSGSEP